MQVNLRGKNVIGPSFNTDFVAAFLGKSTHVPATVDAGLLANLNILMLAGTPTVCCP